MASTYTWDVIAGTLPPGIMLTGGGLTATLIGTPTVAGVYSFTARIQNDQSGAFDTEDFTLTIEESGVYLTPDLGLPLDQAFDSNINSKLILVTRPSMIDLGDVADLSRKYKPRNKLQIRADFGLGERLFEIPASLLRKVVSLNRRYLYRITGQEETTREAIIV